ncbi:MAG: hypothetical protein GW946_00240 [Candidatus Pacebacteria bacterium]|nr:hypothetical protein [Candidatus Paceibacterota bacterium]
MIEAITSDLIFGGIKLEIEKATEEMTDLLSRLYKKLAAENQPNPGDSVII